MPKVSVIIPNFNHAKFLTERIDSVLNQTFSDYEVIILDDCSTDNSKEVIDSYRSHDKIVHIEYNTQNSGSTFKQWEKGIKLAKGEWIWIAESDDVANKEFLNFLMRTKDESAGIVYCRSEMIDDLNQSIDLYGFSTMPDPNIYSKFGQSFTRQGSTFVMEYMLRNNFIPNASAVIFKRDKVCFSVFKIINNTRLLGDWLFWLHILKQTNIGYVYDILNKFRYHCNTVRSKTHYTATRLVEYRSLVRFLKINFGYGKEAIDCLLFHYRKGEVNSKDITFKQHLQILTFIFLRRPLLLLKTYLRKQ
jgi:glycosyltransferase involved in cell wall biosynthesis